MAGQIYIFYKNLKKGWVSKKSMLLYCFIMMKKFLLPISIAALLFSACGSDSSDNSVAADTGNSNVVEDVPGTNPGNGSVVESSGSTAGDQAPETQDPSVSPDVNPGVPETPVDTVYVPNGDTSSVSNVTNDVFPMEVLSDEIAKDRGYVAASAIVDFESIQSVYESLEDGDKVAFVIRHGKRESGTGVESQLTADGVAQSQNLGTLLKGEEQFTYGHTDFVRTRATAINIAFGRGEDTTQFKSTITNHLVASTYIKDMELFEQYKKDSTNFSNEGELYSQWAFDGLVAAPFYDLEARAVQAIVQGILPNMSETNRVNFFISHDMFLMPLMIYVSDRKIESLRYHVSRKGVYYLDGVAVVVKANGERRYHVVYGVER